MAMPAGMHIIDVEHDSRYGTIAACGIETDDGLVLIDPGPSSGLTSLRAALETMGCSTADLTAILLTHIHLDHAGATGTLVRDNPRIEVFVHTRGAKHTIDPTKLLASAQRIYGDRMQPLFGDVVAVPASNVVMLEGGESVSPGGRPIRVEYAPGHASHHVVYLDERSGTAFVGDTAGERFAPSSFVMPVTPPPDIDLELWQDTVRRIRGLDADRLFITHYGAFEDVGRHLEEHQARLDEWAGHVLASLDEAGDDAERADRFARRVSETVRTAVGTGSVEHYEHAGLTDSWVGLARYWRKRRGE